MGGPGRDRERAAQDESADGKRVLLKVKNELHLSPFPLLSVQVGGRFGSREPRVSPLKVGVAYRTHARTHVRAPPGAKLSCR